MNAQGQVIGKIPMEEVKQNIVRTAIERFKSILNIGPPEDFARYFSVKFAYEIFVRTASDRMYEVAS